MTQFEFKAFLRGVIVAAACCVAMAVSCPSPEEEKEPDPSPEVKTKSAELSSFETTSAVGLYIKGSGVVVYDDDAFQSSYNTGRNTYRIQSDDQTRYMHVDFTEPVPYEEGRDVLCTVTYSSVAGKTVLVVKFVTVKAVDGKIWLWNELQKVGVIVPDV